MKHKLMFLPEILQVLPTLLLSVHSFSPSYPGVAPRDYEVGVLSTFDDDLAGDIR